MKAIHASDGKGHLKTFYDSRLPESPSAPAPSEPINASSSNGPMGPPSGDGKGEVLATKEADAYFSTDWQPGMQSRKDFARSLELRLAETRRELEQWKQTAIKDRDENVDLRNELAEAKREVDALRERFGAALASADCEIVALRAQLQKANELLVRAQSVLHKTNWDALANEITTHLNQQSK